MSKRSMLRISVLIGFLSSIFADHLAAQQRGNQPPPGPPPKLTKVQDDLYLIENQGLTTADIGSYQLMIERTLRALQMSNGFRL